MVSFRRVMPRLYELKDRTDPNDPNAYFQNFEESLLSNRSTLEAFLKLERQFCVLEEDAWEHLRQRVVPLLSVRVPGRGWRALFDTLNEAKGYAYLRRIGCTNVRFISCGDGRTPDLQGDLNGGVVLCEVKTFNISEDQAQRLERIHSGEFVSSDVSVSLTDNCLMKLGCTLDESLQQLSSYDSQARARRISFVVIHFDDWLGEYQPQYFVQIDEYLLAHPVEGMELVICPASNLFDRIQYAGSHYCGTLGRVLYMKQTLLPPYRPADLSHRYKLRSTA